MLRGAQTKFHSALLYLESSRKTCTKKKQKFFMDRYHKVSRWTDPLSHKSLSHNLSHFNSHIPCKESRWLRGGAVTWWHGIWLTRQARCEQRWPCSEARGTPTAPSSQRNTGTPPTAGRGTRLWSRKEKEAVNTGQEIISMQCKALQAKKERAPTNQPLHSSVPSCSWCKLWYNTGIQEHALFNKSYQTHL